MALEPDAASTRVVSKSSRKKVGVLQTDAKVLGGFDFRSGSMGQDEQWEIVTELKKQYEVISVSADAPIPTNIDALIVAQPSSLTQKGIENLTAYVRSGKATLLLMDPLPMFNPELAPDLPRSPTSMFNGGQPPEPKGDLSPLLDLLGIDWPWAVRSSGTTVQPASPDSRSSPRTSSSFITTRKRIRTLARPSRPSPTTRRRPASRRRSSSSAA